ncbi:phage repressor protein C with HTH and peptisase S24 domain [Sinorhizobium medicae]
MANVLRDAVWAGRAARIVSPFREWVDMLSHDSIWRAIDALAERHRLSPSGLARRAGLDPTSFNKSKRRSADGRDRWPSTESISKILQATGATVDQFMALMQPNAAGSEKESAPGIPLIGFAQAGAGGFFDDGGFPVGQGWDSIEFPTAERRQTGAYALEVQGDSMLPLYRDGDILIVDPSAQVRRNDRVVVRTREGEVMAKVLARQTPRGIELVSLNPDHPNRNFEMKEVEWIARIIWASQ